MGRSGGYRENLPTETGRELHHDLDHLAVTWTDEEAAAFDAALAEQRRVDPELWG